jgi:hypothetical protein
MPTRLFDRRCFPSPATFCLVSIAATTCCLQVHRSFLESFNDLVKKQRKAGKDLATLVNKMAANNKVQLTKYAALPATFLSINSAGDGATTNEMLCISRSTPSVRNPAILHFPWLRLAIRCTPWIARPEPSVIVQLTTSSV